MFPPAISLPLITLLVFWMLFTHTCQGVGVTLFVRHMMFSVYGNESNFASHTFLKLVTQKQRTLCGRVLLSRRLGGDLGNRLTLILPLSGLANTTTRLWEHHYKVCGPHVCFTPAF